ncbi:MAG: helix-turn-helix transcriptional regulator, partial [Actinomycetaceae bacterium]|nr:helix-turn-helix transcriptional regulator [Actinomycetaceae bacterium]
GVRLKRYREAANMSQLELARAIGYNSKAAISKIENGQRDMPRSLIQLAADALGISPLALFTDDINSSASESALVSTFRQLSARGKEDVLDFANYQLQRERGKKQSEDQRNTGMAN